MGLFGNANERIAQGLDYSHFCDLAQSATDRFRSGGAIGDRTVRLTKNGQGIATTRFSGTQGARVAQIAGARTAYLDAVERAFGLNARMKAAEMLDAEGAGKPLTSRIIQEINDKINPDGVREVRPDKFIASQRAVFDRALQDAVVSVAKLHPGEMINVDPLKIEADVIAQMKSLRVPMTQQGLTTAVAQVVAASVAGARGAVDADAAQIAEAAAAGVAKSAEKAPMPKIRNQAEFVSFFMTLSATGQYGTVREDGEAKDVKGDTRKTFTFDGIVFRGDQRRSNDRTMKTGFTSQNPLSVPANKTEAMGLGVITDGKAGGWGATGKSGVSCARTIAGAIQYLNPGGTFYVIDTTKLPKGEKAWDMEHTVYDNGYKQRSTQKVRVGRPDGFGPEEFVEVPLDETNAEVNVSYVPRSAIVGWVTVPDRSFFDDDFSNESRLNTLQGRCTWDKSCVIRFNPDYRA